MKKTVKEKLWEGVFISYLNHRRFLEIPNSMFYHFLYINTRVNKKSKGNIHTRRLFQNYLYFLIYLCLYLLELLDVVMGKKLTLKETFFTRTQKKI